MAVLGRRLPPPLLARRRLIPPGTPPAVEILALAARICSTAGALAEDARCANAHSVMHVVCDELGEWVAGLGHARRAAELQLASAQLRYNLALSALRLIDYRNGLAKHRRDHGSRAFAIIRRGGNVLSRKPALDKPRAFRTRRDGLTSAHLFFKPGANIP